MSDRQDRSSSLARCIGGIRVVRFGASGTYIHVCCSAYVVCDECFSMNFVVRNMPVVLHRHVVCRPQKAGRYLEQGRLSMVPCTCLCKMTGA